MAEKSKSKSGGARAAPGSLTGLTEEEALEFNQWMIRGTMVYLAFAVVAHALVYMWRPWLPNTGGVESVSGLMEVGQAIASAFV